MAEGGGNGTGELVSGEVEDSELGEVGDEVRGEGAGEGVVLEGEGEQGSDLVEGRRDRSGEGVVREGEFAEGAEVGELVGDLAGELE